MRLSRSCTLIFGEVFKTSMLKTLFIHLAFLYWTWWRCNRRHTIRAMLGWAVITFCRQIKSDMTFSSTNCTYQTFMWCSGSVLGMCSQRDILLYIFLFSPCSIGWSQRVNKISFNWFIYSFIVQKTKSSR